MHMEPAIFFQYECQKLYNVLNGKILNLSTLSVDGYEPFISNYKSKNPFVSNDRLAVQISEKIKKILQEAYNDLTEIKEPCLQDSFMGRLYANGFLAAYNYCKKYADKKSNGRFDFSPYVKNLYQITMLNPSTNTINKNYILNLGRVEGTCFYLKQSGFNNPFTEEVNTEEVNTEEVNTEEVNTKEVNAKEVNAEEVNTEETNAKEVNAKEVNAEEVNTEETFNALDAPCMTIEQNLEKSPNTNRIINKIRQIISEKKDKVIVGYIIIVLKELNLSDSSESVLKGAFKKDFYPNESTAYNTSVNRILRSYRNKGTYSGDDAGEIWGEQRENKLQKIKTEIKMAIHL